MRRGGNETKHELKLGRIVETSCHLLSGRSCAQISDGSDGALTLFINGARVGGNLMAVEYRYSISKRCHLPFGACRDHRYPKLVRAKYWIRLIERAVLPA